MKPFCSLSLDLDNQWSYMKTHGDPGWASYPSYLDTVVPRALKFLEERRLRITFFVVGIDAGIESNRPALRALAEAGHEIGNHSHHHEPWLHLYSDREVDEEIARAETEIERATGRKPIGFRGPGFSVSPAVLETLARRGYLYDASTFPTFIGPLARAYYFSRSRLGPEELKTRGALFGRFRDGFKPNKPYRWATPSGQLVEIPVTTMPGARVPIHVSYLLYLAAVSPALARAYFGTALALCRATGTVPSLLLHPLDFMDLKDAPALGFFPAMSIPAERKMDLVGRALQTMGRHWDIGTMERHARSCSATARILPGASA